MNPFEPPEVDQPSRRRPESLVLRVIGLLLFGTGLVNVLVGLGQIHGLGWGRILFGMACFGLGYVAFRKR